MKKRYFFGCLIVMVMLTACYFNNVPTHFTSDAFHRAKTSPINRISGMATDGNRVVAVSTSGVIAWSDDHGENWKESGFKDNELVSGISFNAVAWADGYYFAGGDGGKAAWSRDGETWSAGVIGPMNPENIHAVSVGRMRQQLVFVAAGTRGRIAYALNSPEGPWFHVLFTPFGDQEVNGSTESVNALAYGKVHGDSVFVAVGDNGKIAIMNDFSGNFYGPSAIGTQLPFYGLTFGNERFIAVGEGATVKISADPEYYAWNTIRKSSFGMEAFTIIAFAPAFNYFVMVSGDSIVRFSEYGESWTAANFSGLFERGISAVVGTKKKIILSGLGGEIYYSN